MLPKINVFASDTGGYFSIHINLKVRLKDSTELRFTRASTKSLSGITADTLFLESDAGTNSTVAEIFKDMCIPEDREISAWFISLWKEAESVVDRPSWCAKTQYYFDDDGNEYCYVDSQLNRVYTKDVG